MLDKDNEYTSLDFLSKVPPNPLRSACNPRDSSLSNYPSIRIWKKLTRCSRLNKNQRQLLLRGWIGS